MSLMMWLRKKLFETRFVAFRFGYDTHIRKIRTTSTGKEYALCYGILVSPDEHREWREI